MGVKDLWSVLSPVCEKRSLWELQDKIIAIDLSAWICDSQCFSRQAQINMYLRNLFFRTSYLLLLGAKPVFVLEGKAPEVKAKTIENRLKKTTNSENNSKPHKPSRSRLKSLQKQCTELLSYLGVSCIEAPGEAEAYCAHLNKLGLVDGIISQDSDAFLYGAREVYRNFQMAPKYTYDHYSMDKIEEKLGLSRTKLIGFSLLTGSDYSSGIHNVGKEMTLKFLNSISDEMLFQRFTDWKYESNLYNSGLSQKSKEIEDIVREKAIQDKNFPYIDVIQEFTTEPDSIVDFQYKWNKPDLNKFIILAVKKLMWDDEYSTKKMVPLIGRWHLINNGVNCANISIKDINVAPRKSDTHYKITWNLFDIVTIECKNLVEKSYPDMVGAFEEF